MIKFEIKAKYFNKLHKHIINANSERHAINLLYANLGSKNGLKRNQIEILEVLRHE